MDLERFLLAVDQLASLVPELAHLLDPSRVPPTSWSALLERAGALRRQGGRLSLVVTLYGPTGAGNSTLFKRLTGIEVPAGDEIRPLSRGCAMAVPPDWGQPAMESVLPGFDLRPLDKPERLRQEDGLGLVWYRSASNLGGEPGAGADSPALFLLDVPDFNSLELKNADRAERVLRRAEVVVFVVQGDAYADQSVVTELEHCCRVAARLTVIITKVAGPGKARAKWNDLLDDKLVRENLKWRALFQRRREDGRTQEAFLRACPVYAWPFAENPDLADLVPVSEGAPSLASQLLGLDARRVASEGLLQAGADSALWIHELAQVAEVSCQERLRWRESVDADLARAGSAVAGQEFPLGRTLEVLMEESRAGQHQVFRWVAYPFNRLSAWMQGGFKVLSDTLRAAINRPGNGNKLAHREDLERKSLGRVAQELLDTWRDRWPAWLEKPDSATCHRATAILLDSPLPAPAIDWEGQLRQSAREWVEKNPNWAYMLPVALDVTTVGGVGLFVLDLGTTGGLLTGHAVVGTMGATGLVAGGAGLAAMLARMADKMHFRGVLEAADKSWREQRSREIATHLRRYLLPELLGAQGTAVDRLVSFPLDEMRELAQDLMRKPEQA